MWTYNTGRGLSAFGPLSIGVLADRFGLGTSIMWIGAIAAVLGLLALSVLPETRNKHILASVATETLEN